jgi:hypothetical protein
MTDSDAAKESWVITVKVRGEVVAFVGMLDTCPQAETIIATNIMRHIEVFFIVESFLWNDRLLPDPV